MYYLLLPSRDERNAFIEHLGRRGILAVFHYVPLHLSPMGRRFGGRVGDCRVTEDVSDRLVRLPLYNDMSSEEQGAVIEAVCGFA
jgi:dTDP-4-amino-4,6-dideoxygalactose transaminase